MWAVRFHDGTLVVEGASLDDLPSGFVRDDRVGAFRGPADRYAQVVMASRRLGAPLQDDARGYAVLDELPLATTRTPRPYQQEAVQAWMDASCRGAIILPTGTGKSFVAELAIAQAKRSTLVVAPTLDLVGQWHDRLHATFGQPIGILGGGHHIVEDITVSTYDSAYIHLPRYGDRFGLLVFDEVHHLPAPGYLQAATASVAPFRLGLTATWEREDGRESELLETVGPIVYRREIHELAGSYLADYQTVKLQVSLTDDEQARYEEARGLYRSFIGQKRIPMGSPRGWQIFLRHASRSKAGREAFKAYQESRRIAHGTDRKLDLLGTLLDEERGRRTLIFTHDNATAYKISREFLVPCITHQTPLLERQGYLQAFERGDLPILATSRVLNEGVDLPAAEVAIVLSGTGTVREHVQRLGRILRPGEGKQAILYEIVASNTSEENTSRRRRRHDAYK